jgi:hypothetical protein
LAEDFMKCETADEMRSYADTVAAKGTNGITILLCVLRRSLDEPFLTSNYVKSKICIETLRKLASQGIFTNEEVPVLVHALYKQIHIIDTYPTAETLRTITGIDPGYSKAFVESYTAKDEPERREKIQKWEGWWNKNKHKLKDQEQP